MGARRSDGNRSACGVQPMKWTAVTDALPADAALICADGIYYLAVLVGTAADPAFMELHSSDLLPWPSHWMNLPPPPAG